jgi:iron complex outermembrane receptor protein
MTRFNELSKSVRLALTLGAVATAAPAAVAFAQDQDAEQLDTITVVGSRIKRTDIETSQPVFVLERQDLQRTGLTSVGDILQDLSTSGATLNTTFNNGGNGETRIDLRNLGANRTLVLVNGRRVGDLRHRRHRGRGQHHHARQLRRCGSHGVRR